MTLPVRRIEGVNGREAIVQDIQDGHHLQSPCITRCIEFAKLHETGVYPALQQELCVLVNAVVVHATPRMAGVLINPVQLVMLWNET